MQNSAQSSLFRSFKLNPNKILRPCDIVLGGIWLGPGSGSKTGNGNHVDLGQENANDVIQAAIDVGITQFDTAPWYMVLVLLKNV